MVAADECDGDEAGALVAAACTGTGTDTGSTQDAPAVRSPRAAWALFVEESRRLWAIGAPIALNIICLYGTNSTTQIFAGHIGNLELSAVAVGLSVVSNFSFGFLLGMGSALETLCGQAFGAGQVSMLGVYMQRSWIILAASAALLTPLYVYAAPLLRLLGQDPAMAAAAGDFTIVALLALFVTALGWGVAGAALAYDLSSWLTSLAQLAYVVGWCRDGWTGLSRAAFTDLWAFVRLSLASA
ncbi:Putative MATE efflux family protein [Zea mays]|uniref:Putative MATE efflux family protein n=1 Tax=Zea mays TaxID=4577 RepID=A0A1D6QAP6_MAIZE|nr:Putative MATE efflux family protein [Zea mays]